MELTDKQLIQNTLNGDHDSFAQLVRRYQNRVHALAWRNIGDFHIAEEITQDTFLRAYRKLGSLKNPNLFAGWLYVIANRLCKTWLSKKGNQMQSLDTVPTDELEAHTFSEYTARKREEHASDVRGELVKRLLQKLPESERIVITLHYLAESSVKEISEFLGVSMNTVKSRLHRARKRLQKEEHMLRETLGTYQASNTLTENIIRNIKQTGTQIDPPSSKPFVPIVSTVSALILVTLMLGLGSQYIARFQKPYNPDSTSKMSVEIVDATVMMNLPSVPDVRNQMGNLNSQNVNDGANQTLNTMVSSSTAGRVVDEVRNPISGINIALTPVRKSNGVWSPIRRDENGDPIDMSLYQAQTNMEGHFTVANPLGGPVQLSLFPARRSDYKISRIQIAGMYFFPSERVVNGGVVFATSPDALHEDIEVILKQPKLRIRVLRGDGTPLANTTIKCHISIQSIDGGSTSEIAADTDEKGYFVHYFDEFINENVTYTCKMTATYKTQKAYAGPFELKLKPLFSMHNLVLIMREEQGIIPSVQENAHVNTPSQIDASDQKDRPYKSIVPKPTSTLSGQIVNVEGKPVVNVPVYIRAIRTSDIQPASNAFSPHFYLSSKHSQTNDEGSFAFKGVSAQATIFGLLNDSIDKTLPDDLAKKSLEDLDREDLSKLRSLGFFDMSRDDFEPEYKVLSIRKDGITNYPLTDSYPIVFGIKPGTQCTNVVVTVRQRMRVRGRLLFEDGTPVANTRFNLRESSYPEDGSGFSTAGGKPKTDAEGYFIYYPKEMHDSRQYIFGLRYKGMVAESEPILLKPGEKYEELTLQLESIP